MESGVEVIPKKQYDEEIQRLKKKFKPNNLFGVTFSSSLEFFKQYCVFIKPFVNLTDREQDVIASFLNQRYELSKEIKNETTLDTLLMTRDVRNRIIQESHITPQHFWVVMSTLRKKGIFDGDRLIPEVIPNIKVDDNGVFKLMIMFTNESEENGV